MVVHVLCVQLSVRVLNMQAGISFTAIISNCGNVIKLKVARIVSTQKANRAARFIARHIEVETLRLCYSCFNYV